MSRQSTQHRKIFGRGLALVGSLAAGLAVAFVASGSASGSPAASTTTTTTTTKAVEKPQNTSPPSVSGTPQQGQKLTGSKGTWANNPTDFNYFWVRCDKSGGSCSDISNAHAATYTLTSADVGNTVR